MVILHSHDRGIYFLLVLQVFCVGGRCIEPFYVVLKGFSFPLFHWHQSHSVFMIARWDLNLPKNIQPNYEKLRTEPCEKDRYQSLALPFNIVEKALHFAASDTLTCSYNCYIALGELVEPSFPRTCLLGTWNRVVNLLSQFQRPTGCWSRTTNSCPMTQDVMPVHLSIALPFHFSFFPFVVGVSSCVFTLSWELEFFTCIFLRRSSFYLSSSCWKACCSTKSCFLSGHLLSHELHLL